MNDHHFMLQEDQKNRYIYAYIYTFNYVYIKYMHTYNHVCECVYMYQCVHNIYMQHCLRREEKDKAFHIYSIGKVFLYQEGSAGSFHIKKMSYVIHPCQIGEISTYSWLPS